MQFINFLEALMVSFKKNTSVVPANGKTLVTKRAPGLISLTGRRQTDRHHNQVAYCFLLLHVYRRAKAKMHTQSLNSTEHNN